MSKGYNMRRILSKIFVINILWLQTAYAGTPFTCDSNSYLFGSDLTYDRDRTLDSANTTAYKLDLKDGTISGSQTFGSHHINAIGYNVDDDYIYGFEFGTRQIVRVDAEYNIERFDITGLPDEDFYIGDVSLDGVFYLAKRDEDSMSDETVIKEIQRVDLATMELLEPLTLKYPYPLFKKIYSADFAFNPKDNRIYTVNALNDHFYRIDPESGDVTDLGDVGVDNTYSVISFFDKEGFFYFYKDDDRKLYKIDVSDPEHVNPRAVYFSNISSSLITSGDGARCPNAPIAIEEKDPVPVSGKPFECNANSYLFGSDQDADYANAYDMSLVDGNISLVKQIEGSHINATGYNVKDNYIYGFEYGDLDSVFSKDKYFVVRIDADFNKERFKIDGLPDQAYYLGDVSFDGVYYLANRQQNYTSQGRRWRHRHGTDTAPGDQHRHRWRGGRDTRDNADVLLEIQRVDTATMTLLPKLTLNYPANVAKIVSADFAFSPKDHKLYTINAANNALYRIDPDTGNVENLGYVGVGDTYSVISFFDTNGYFYFYKNDDRKVYRIDVSDPEHVNPVAEEFSDISSEMITSGDGARCPNAEVVPQESEMTPVSEYRMDACMWNGYTGEVKDSKGNNPATAKNGATTAEGGKINRAGEFTGNNYLDAGDSFNDILGTESNQFTITAWINPAQLTDARTNHYTKNTFIAKASDRRNDNLEIGVNPDGSLHLYLDTRGRDRSANIGGGISTNSWHFVAVSYQDGVVRVNIDGQSYINDTTWANGGYIDQAVGSPFTIGASLHVDNFFTGKIDEVKIYKNALTQDQVQEIYTAEAAGKSVDGTVHQEEICPVGCTDKALVIAYNKTERPFVEEFYEIDLITGESTRFDVGEEDLNASYVNGFGYNIADGYMWGSDVVNKGNLVKIGKGSDGNYKQVTINVPGLPQDASTYIGDIDNNGYLYLYYPSSKRIYRVELDPNRSDFDVTYYQFNSSVNIADMAVNPVDGKIYALDPSNNFYRFDLGDQPEIVLLAERIIDWDDNGWYGTSFFDNAGYFYAIGNDNKKTVRIKVDGENSSAVWFSRIDIDRTRYSNDGARCNQAPIKIDFADAPDSYGSSLAMNGARHKQPSTGNSMLYFGNGVDVEPDARLDDGDRQDDGVESFDPLYVGDTTYQVTLKVHNDTGMPAYIGGWIDFNMNGVFDADEGVVRTLTGSAEVTLQWNNITVPDSGTTYARFRISTGSIDTGAVLGALADGEVEDYKLTIRADSVYDAYTTMVSDQPRLTTQVVNRGFTVNLVRLTPDNNDTDTKFRVVERAVCDQEFDPEDMDGFIDFDLSSASIAGSSALLPVMSIFDTGNSGAQSGVSPQIVVDKAIKEAKIQFYWKQDGRVKTSCSTDSFAVRPDKFKIELPAQVKAGESFMIRVKALDGNASSPAPVDNYSELLQIGTSSIVNDLQPNQSVVVLDYNETKPNCITGRLTTATSGLQTEFVNGVAELNVTYSEVGTLKLDIYEKSGFEYAKVDSNENSVAITAAHENMTFDPAKIVVGWDLHNGDSYNGYTYFNNYSYTDDALSTMYATLDLNVSAMDQNDQKVQNFSSACYAEDVSFAISYQLESDDNVTYNIVASYQDANETYLSDSSMLPDTLSSGSGMIDTLKLEKSLFVDGVGEKRVKFNFTRDASQPRNPVLFSINSLSATVDSTLSVTDDNTKRLKFLYVRAHIPDQEVVGKTMNAKVYYEVYCKECDMSRYGLANLPESVDSIYWYQLSTIEESEYFDFDEDPAATNGLTAAGTISAVSNIFERIENRDNGKGLYVEVSKAPLTVRLKYEPKKYLVFNPFNASVTEHSFTADFVPEGKSWAGKGDLGFTVDTDIAPRNNIDVIDW